MAASWLASAHPNRALSRMRVRRIAAAIRGGLWQVNGATIVVCQENKLLDGRHRLSAIVEAGESVQSFITIGVDALSFPTMDQGRKRSASDILSMSGHKQSQILASALRWLWRYKHQQMLLASIPVEDYQLPGYLTEHQTIIKSLDWGSMLRSMIPAGSGSMLHLCMSEKDPALAKEFFQALATGVSLESTDPVYGVCSGYV
jgi:hypothetical protein